MARQAGVEEGIWTELWSRSLPVRLTQQQPCHRPNPPNHPIHHGGARDEQGLEGRIVKSNGRVRKSEGKKNKEVRGRDTKGRTDRKK